MSHHGSKYIFLSDFGSNFWPLANRYATPPDKEIPSLPPFWRKLLTKDLETLQKHGGYIWLLFSKSRHEAVSRVEIMVNKMKVYLRKAGIFEDFKTGKYTKSDISVILASLVTSLNTRPLAIYQNEILTPETFHYHNYTMRTSSDSILAMVENANHSILDQIKSAEGKEKYDKAEEYKSFRK